MKVCVDKMEMWPWYTMRPVKDGEKAFLDYHTELSDDGYERYIKVMNEFNEWQKIIKAMRKEAMKKKVSE